jgi:hypothetical protein
MTFQELKEEYKKVFYLEDDGVLDVAFATVLSTYINGDPIWTMIVGASSGGKSEVVNLFSKLDWVWPISDITENTLLSGAYAENASLLDQIGPIGCIVMKDFTSVLSMRQEKKTAIIAQFREMYDGDLEKKTGSGNNPSWHGKMTFLAGVTDAIYTEDQNSGVMGQRAIHYVLPNQDRITTTRAARKNRRSGNIKALRERLQDLTVEYIEDMKAKLPNGIPEVDEKVSEEIIHLAEMATRARTGITRNYRGEIQMVTSIEMPMRVSEQIHAIAGMFVFMNGGEPMTLEQRKIIYKICIDCIPKNRREALMKLVEYWSVGTQALARAQGWDIETARVALQDLNVLGMVERKAAGIGTDDLWGLSDEYRKLLSQYLDIKEKHADLLLTTEDDEEESVDEDDPLASF